MVDVDPLLLLAYAVNTSPGVYAVLLGSGVSSSAGIPTGWAITLDLTARVAALEGQDAGDDPARWHEDRFGAPPDYSMLLNLMGRTPAERQEIVRSFIEPTEDDRANGRKIPTEAHRALARLAAAGYIRVILTTNFDRLIEQALTDAGVDFDVIASVDAIAGARPIGQAPCVVIKLHGDYRDARIRNTQGELTEYPEEFRRLLDRVLDEHGLIVSGWSATWDTALRDTILRQPNRRYTMYWATRSSLSSEAEDVVRARSAAVIEGIDAETLFTRLADKVDGLALLGRAHPLSTATAVAELKRALPDPTKRIQVRDLLMAEANRVHGVLIGPDFEAIPPTADGLRDAVARYEARLDTLLALFGVGSAWADDSRPFAEALERVANATQNWGGPTDVVNIRRYPGLLCLYTAGVAAIHAGRWEMLRALTTDATLLHPNGKVPMARGLTQWEVLGVSGDAIWLPGQDRMLTPASNHIFAVIRDVLRDTIPSDARYDDDFDRFEYLLGVIIQDLQNIGFGGGPRAPIGRFGWKHAYIDSDMGNSLVANVRAEADAHGERWPPLVAGLFGGDSGRLKEAFDQYQYIVDWARNHWL